MRVVGHRLAPPFVGQREHEGQRGVIERVSRSAWHRARHVGHAIVDDAVDLEGGLGMGRDARGLEAPALVDGDVDQHRPFAHPGDMLARDQPRRHTAGHQHRADHQIGVLQLGREGFAVRVRGDHPRSEAGLDPAQGVQRTVQHRHARARPDRHDGGIGADHAGAQHQHPRGFDSGHAAQQDAHAPAAALQAGGTDLDRQPPGHFGHRREQRQAAAAGGDGLVGDAHRAAGQQIAALPGVGRKMQVGEQHLSGPQPRPLGRLRLLDLDDEVAEGEHLRPRRNQAGAGLAVVGIAGADAGPGAGLDHDAVAVRDDFTDRSGRQAHPILVDLDLPWHADEHRSSSW